MFAKSDIEDVMYGRRSSRLIAAVLLPLSLVYGILVLLRTVMYRAGICQAEIGQEPVISVGNLTLGGTGKTPTVMNIAAVLRKQGRRPAVDQQGIRQEERIGSSDRFGRSPGAGGCRYGRRRTGPDRVQAQGCSGGRGKRPVRAAALAGERFGNDCVYPGRRISASSAPSRPGYRADKCDRSLRERQIVSRRHPPGTGLGAGTGRRGAYNRC